MPSGKVHDQITIVTALAAVPVWWWVSPSHDPVPLAAGLAAYVFSGFWLSDDLDTRSVSYKRWGPLRFLWWPYQKCVPHRSWVSHGLGFGPLFRVAYFLAMLWLVCVGLGWCGDRLGLAFSRDDLFRALWTPTVSWTTTHPSIALAALIGLILGGVAHSVADTVVSFAKKVW